MTATDTLVLVAVAAAVIFGLGSIAAGIIVLRAPLVEED